MTTKPETDVMAGVEPVAWITPLRYGSQVTFYKPRKPDNWDDGEEDWYCHPLYNRQQFTKIMAERDAERWWYVFENPNVLIGCLDASEIDAAIASQKEQT